MATKLTKTLSRELLHGDDRGRALLVELLPGDRIAFRLKGKRTRYETSLHSVFVLALMEQIHSKYREDLELYDYRRKAGYKGLRRPRKPTLAAFSTHLKDVLSISPPLRRI